MNRDVEGGGLGTMTVGATATRVPTRDTSARRKARFEQQVSRVFGFVLGLSALSLTGVDITSVDDLVDALETYVPSFFLVVIMWQIAAELGDRYPEDADAWYYAPMTVTMFLATLAPVLLNLLFRDQLPQLQDVIEFTFPIVIAAIFAILAVMWARLLWLERLAGGDQEHHIISGLVVAVVMSLFFLVSLLLPFSFDDPSPREIAWMASLALPFLVRWGVMRALAPGRGATATSAAELDRGGQGLEGDEEAQG
jgi:hypothetical protein